LNFSNRTQWNLSPNRLSVLLTEKRAHGEQIIDLTESNPTRCGFPYPEQEILTALSDNSILTYKPKPRGLLSAREAISEYYRRNDISVSPENIILTSSTSEAYTFLLKLLCNTNDEVTVTIPSYPLFEYLCQINDVALRHYNLIYDGEWHTDFETLESSITDKTRAIVAVHPNNPTGSYFKIDEFEKICSLANKHNLAVIVDEVFSLYAFQPDKRRAVILNSDLNVPVFSLNGISKLLGLPQLKLSWIVAGGNSKYTSEALKRLDIIADSFLSVNTPVQIALPKLIKLSSNIGTIIHKRVESNYTMLQSVFRNSNATVLNTEGGWYAILQLPQTKTDEQWADKILSRLNILVYPGYFFDIPQKSSVVVSLLPDIPTFENAVSLIKQYIS
jgi:alanine-synthesizing transaminase